MLQYSSATALRMRPGACGSVLAAPPGAQAAAMTPKASKRLIALDFDGVVCDSVGESSQTAFKAAAVKWPELFNTPAAAAQRDSLMEGMRAVRPVVETGYENIVQIRCLLEGETPAAMLASWHDMLPQKMQQWQLDRQELVHLFGSIRDQWMEEDLRGWLGANAIYPGVAPVLQQLVRDPDAEVYIVTTKQAHYTAALLRDMAGVDLPSERIHSTTLSGEPKAAVLARLAAAHPGAQQQVFVEDKMGTLLKVAATPSASTWQLLLVDWGYNTIQERAAAADHPSVQLVDLGEFSQLLLQSEK